MKQNNKIKRKYMINKKFQIGNALKITAIQLPCIVSTMFLTSWFCLVLMDNRLYISSNPAIFLHMFLLCVLISCGVLFFSIRYTHSIAGPVHKAGLILTQIAKGNLPEQKIVFRGKDSFADLSEDLNCMIDSLKEDRLTHKRSVEKLESLKHGIINNNIDQKQYLKKVEEILNTLNINKINNL